MSDIVLKFRMMLLKKSRLLAMLSTSSRKMRPVDIGAHVVDSRLTGGCTII